MNPDIKQCGKVIEYDFAPRPKLDVMVSMKGTTLYVDDRVMLVRYEFTSGGRPFGTCHYMADLATGAITHL